MQYAGPNQLHRMLQRGSAPHVKGSNFRVYGYYITDVGRFRDYLTKTRTAQQRRCRATPGGAALHQQPSASARRWRAPRTPAAPARAPRLAGAAKAGQRARPRTTSAGERTGARVAVGEQRCALGIQIELGQCRRPHCRRAFPPQSGIGNPMKRKIRNFCFASLFAGGTGDVPVEVRCWLPMS